MSYLRQYEVFVSALADHCVLFEGPMIHIEGTSVRDALEQTKDLQLMHTKLTMDEFHNPKGKDGYMLEAKDGSAVFYKKIRPEA